MEKIYIYEPYTKIYRYLSGKHKEKKIAFLSSHPSRRVYITICIFYENTSDGDG